MALTVAELKTVLTADISKLQAGLATAKKSVDGFGEGMNSFGKGVESAGKKMTTAFTVPVVGALGFAAKSFGDFETSLNTFKNVAGATAAEMEQVGKLSKELGNDVKLPGKSAKDAADSMLELAKAGLSVTDSMDAVRAVMQLATAANIENAEAAVIVGDALNAFKLDGKKAIKVADLLAGAANSASGEITDMAFSLQMSAAVFASANVPIEDLVTSIALMAKNGIKGSDAGTSLKTSLIHLQNPSEKAAGVMKELNFNIYDAQGNMKTMREIVENLSRSTAGLTQEQKAQALATLFGTDGVRAANILLAEGVKGFDAMKASVTEAGAAQDVANAKSKGLNGSIEALKSSLETAAITIGEKIAPIIKRWADGLSDLVNKFDKLDPEMQDWILKIVAATALLGPLAIAVGKVSQSLSFLAAHPMVAVVAGLAALSVWFQTTEGNAATLRYSIARDWEIIANSVLEGIAFILDGFSNFAGGIAYLLELAAHLPGVGGKFAQIGEDVRRTQRDIDSMAASAHKGIDQITSDAERFLGTLQRMSWETGNIMDFANMGVNPATNPRAMGPVPRFHSGGVVPGPRGAEVPAVLQAGETVLPAGASMGGTVINITVAGDSDPDGAARRIHEILRSYNRRTGSLGFT